MEQESVPRGFQCFRSLKLLAIHNCGSFKNIFTIAMALGLVQLQRMEVKGCTLLEGLINDSNIDQYVLEAGVPVFSSQH